MTTTPSILVTGGAGYIGSHACKILYNNGYLPIAFDNLSSGNRSSVKWGPLIEADLRDRVKLRSAFIKYNPCAVMHFAADSIVSESVKNPGKYYENNLCSTLVLLEEMVKHKVKKIVFSSSCAIYGKPTSVPISEDSKKAPISPYGKSKLMIEEILEDYENAYNINYASLRYFNAAGADLDCEIGENHKNETHLIPLVIQTAQGIYPHINIFGTNYKTKDGSAIRDYIHVIDLIDAHIKALDYISKNNKSIKLNLGTGNGYSVIEVIKEIKKITGIDLQINYNNRRYGDPPSLYANNDKANKTLKWTPIYSDLKSIVTSAWKWHEKLKKENL